MLNRISFKHLGADLSGGVMMDAMPVGRMFGPNLTLGEGSVTREYTAADWDRAVRHGVGTDGRPLVMPALDFQLMSDQELADIVTYIANGGTGHFFGVTPASARIEISPFEIFRRQLTLVGSHSLNHNIPEALDVIRTYGPGITGLVSHQLPIEEIASILKGKAPVGSLKIQSCRS